MPEDKMITLDDFERLKREVAEVQRQRDRAAGALEQTVRRIKKDFKCTDLSAAEELLKVFQKRERKYAEEYRHLKEEFEKKWKRALEELK